MTHLSRPIRLLGFALLFCLALLLIGGAQAQQRKGDDEPLISEYRGVKIGWLAEDVRKKLGTPANKSDEQDYFMFGDKETVQILYDKAQKVVTISVDFSNGASEVLTPQQVFGAEIEAKSDGSKYKMVRYPKAGIWLSYNRTAGNSPMVTVTLQKMVP
jgi:hypothetical protein